MAKDICTPQFKNNYSKYEEKIKEYEKYCKDNLKLKILYRETTEIQATVIIEPKCINYKANQIFIQGFNPISAQNQDINFDEIIEVSQLPLKANISSVTSSITFKLYGKLANGYRLHDGERLLKTNEDGTTLIINPIEDEKLLLKRLLRYGTLCEVISPKKVRANMKNLISKTLAQYK